MNPGRETASPVTYVSLLAAVLFWGASFAATKLVLREFTVPAYMFVRFAAASVLFGILLLIRGVPRLDRRDHIRLLLVALFEPGLYFLFETEGLSRTGAADAALIIASIPVVVGALSRVILGERQSRRTVIGAVLSILGVGAIVYGSGTAVNTESSLVGNLLVVGAVIAAALYMITARSLSDRVSTFHLTAFQIFYGAIFFAPLHVLTAERMRWESVTIQSVVALLFLVVFATFVAFLAYNRALRDITAARAAVWLNGIPVVTAVTAWILLGERLGLHHLLGGGLVLLGVFYASLRGRGGTATTVPGK